jgi:hypothetical protein
MPKNSQGATGTSLEGKAGTNGRIVLRKSWKRASYFDTNVEIHIGHGNPVIPTNIIKLLDGSAYCFQQNGSNLSSGKRSMDNYVAYDWKHRVSCVCDGFTHHVSQCHGTCVRNEGCDGKHAFESVLSL